VSPRFLEHAVLLSPNRLARAAAGRTGLAEERWMLHQPRSVRASYARAVLRSPDPERAQAAWLLRQPDGVRESYVRDVLGID
jgi:hypothetical protein